MDVWPAGLELEGARVQVVEQAAEVAGKIIMSPPKTDAGRQVVTLPKVAAEALATHLEKYQHVMADRQAQLASVLDDLARAELLPQRARRRR